MSYGLRIVNIGSGADSGDGDSARNAGIKVNTNFVDIYSQFGDIPVDQNPASPTYATRLGVNDIGSSTLPGAFLHPAGYWQKITALNPGVTRPSDGSDGNIFPISRGEQIIVDFEQLDDNESFTIHLPIARKGDVVKIRDAYNTLTNGKKLKIFASPIIYSGGDLSTWLYGERTGGSNRSPEPSHVKIGGISRSHTGYTRTGADDPNQTIPTTLSNDELIFETRGVNIELVYGGDYIGWTVYKLDPFDPAADLKGKELYKFPMFNTKRAYTSSGAPQQQGEVVFNPNVLDGFILRQPTDPSGSQFWEGGFGGSNTVYVDDTLLTAGSGNSFIIKNTPGANTVGGATYEEEPWNFYLPYPSDSFDEESYESRSVTILNDSDMPFIVRPMWKDREGLPQSGKDFTTTVTSNGTGTDLSNYDFVEGAYDSGVINADGIFIQFEADVSKVKFVYGDYNKYSGSKKQGWILSEIETKQGVLNKQREFIITDTANGVNGEFLPRYESEIEVTKLDVGANGTGTGVINIITGNGADPLLGNDLAVIEAIDLEVYVNGVLLTQGAQNDGDYYAFKGLATDVTNANPLDYANTPVNDRRYTLFNSIHFNKPLLPNDHIKVKWKTLVELDAVQAAAILDLINTQLTSIISSIGGVSLSSSGTATGYGIIKQGGSNIGVSGVSSQNFVLENTDWDQGTY